MTIAESKNISLEAILEKHGLQPARRAAAGGDLWYPSPFRNEKEPNFHVNRQRNVWFDFGAGQGGDALDLVCKLAQCGKNEGLKLLEEHFANAKRAPESTFILQENNAMPGDAPLKLLKTQTIEHPGLIKYLTQERFLKLTTCQRFLKELHFENPATGKQYFAAGLPNRAGGWEIRNPYFKSSLGGKDASVFRGDGAGEGGRRSVSIFEGMMDFLSAAEFYGPVLTSGDVFVLNSMAFLEKTLAELEAEKPARIYTYFDNDSAGNEAAQQVGLRFPGKAEPCHALYFPCKDFNEWWVRKKR